MGIVIEWLTLLVSSTFVKSLLKRLFVALGVSAVTYTGVQVGFSAIESQIGVYMAGVPGDVLAMLQLMHIPQAFNVMLSGYAGALSLRGLTASGNLTRLVVDKSASQVL